ncbi:hypothetical protein K402DRAFT_342559 [Aulographum hederae CBS 113979]|uniref:Zn(2)-C6 fungal-type domain-containing protein n=1 Tax=Aulographum hederae CBS 113979 TaxID=1176131 RepID=A0A6G1GKK8_9PEZI|nr:hypothetical protein K402DRAFT_342559 [Aulographum hederae CBS 113979]
MTAKAPLKRSRSHDDDDDDVDGLHHDAPHHLPKPVSPTASSVSSSSASSFRNVSACNRCRLRKNRCDQRLPACASCEKAHVKCVGYDPITKREIPRSYVYYLESRVSYLENLLRDNSLSFVPPEHFALSFKPDRGNGPAGAGSLVKAQQSARLPDCRGAHESTNSDQSAQNESDKLNKLVSNIGMVSVQGTSDPRYLGSTSGISFARVVFAAVKSSVSGTSSERGSIRGGVKPLPAATTATGGTSMRDSFFGLQTKPTIKPAPFPDRDLALRLVDLYFEHANPQIPVLHRGEFMSMFERAYKADERSRTARELYLLNIVFAIGAGIIMGSSSDSDDSEGSDSPKRRPMSPPSQKKRKISSHQCHPEEYHASAIVHLESFLGSSAAADRPDGFGGGLEELQAVLLLAGFALLRPVAPGLWYIIGVAVRLAIDLGLHYEDGVGIDGIGVDDVPLDKVGDKEDAPNAADGAPKIDRKERGRRQWVRDLRRRLWWCVYSLDRLVSTCVGRPFGITDQVVTTEFPSLLDDKYITKDGFVSPPGGIGKPSYKFVAHHYFRLRLLQSEILQVLQHRQAQAARASGANQGNEFMHTKLSSPFLEGFESFGSWRMDIDRRLWEWKESAPNQVETGVQFSPLFLELNYWQAVIMLYRQSLTVPPVLANELGSTNEDVQSPGVIHIEEREDEERVFLKVAEAGQKVLKIYRQLHLVHLVNYTFLATHHLFMAAGISFLYAIWHSTTVRSHLSLDDVDFTVLAATSVLGDLIEKCPPAEACRDAFDRMSKATIQMCLSTTGFGPQANSLNSHSAQPFGSPSTSTSSPFDPSLDNKSQQVQQNYFTSSQGSRIPVPRFDMNLRDLFSEDLGDFRPSFARPPQQAQLQSSSSGGMPPPQLPQQQVNPSPNFSSNNTSQGQTSPGAAAGGQISPYQISNQLPYTSFASSISQTYPSAGPFGDLDFLDSFPVGNGSFGNQGNNGMSGNGTSGGNNTGGFGGGGEAGDLNLGFGMGWELGGGNHDWADGGGIDLFDGFFFGGGG